VRGTKFLVTFEVFDTIIGQDVMPLRETFAKQLGYVRNPGKLVTGGMLADMRGGFFVPEADTGFELQTPFGEGLLDHCHVKCHAVYECDELLEFFRKSAAEHGG
jgi:hypothetical protein